MKKSADSQKSGPKSKQQINTANNANAAGDKSKKKTRGKKGDEENNPSLALGIDLKNFPQTTKNATKRLKLVKFKSLRGGT